MGSSKLNKHKIDYIMRAKRKEERATGRLSGNKCVNSLKGIWIYGQIMRSQWKSKEMVEKI